MSFNQSEGQVGNSNSIAQGATPLASHPQSRAGALARVTRAKRSYVTRNANFDVVAQLRTDAVPQAGDLVLARIDDLGHHRRLESPEGRRQYLYPGDEVVLSFGARYASDQFEAIVPASMAPCHLVAAGGIAAELRERNASVKYPTAISPIGLLADSDGRVLNLRECVSPVLNCAAANTVPVFAVVGTSMNAGKTTTGSTIVRALRNRGRHVGVGKVTGTGAGGDRWQYQDAGASAVVDFSDFGYASTYQVPVCETRRILNNAISMLTAQGCNAIVIEVADGLYFDETAQLVSSAEYEAHVDLTFLAAGDSLSAVSALELLATWGVQVAGVSGKITASPLATRELMRVTDTPVLDKSQIVAGDWASAELDAPGEAARSVSAAP